MKQKYIFPLIWFSLICYASLIPSDNVPKFTIIPHFDKVVHFGLYFVLAILVIPAFVKNKLYRIAYIVSIFISITTGCIFEWLQYSITSSRSASLLDGLANAAGAITGVLFYQLFIKNKSIEFKIFKIE